MPKALAQEIGAGDSKAAEMSVREHHEGRAPPSPDSFPIIRIPNACCKGPVRRQVGNREPFDSSEFIGFCCPPFSQGQVAKAGNQERVIRPRLAVRRGAVRATKMLTAAAPAVVTALIGTSTRMMHERRTTAAQGVDIKASNAICIDG